MAWKNGYDNLVALAMDRINAVGAEAMLDLGAETKAQNRINRAYMDRITFELRVLKTPTTDVTTQFLGFDLPAPIICSPLAMNFRLLRATVGKQAYLAGIARGVAQSKTIMMVTVEPHLLQGLMDQGTAIIPVIKPWATSRGSEDELIEFQIRDAESRGAVAICMDIDCFFGEKVGSEWPYGSPMGVKTVAQLRRYAEATRLPFLLKGILSVYDARVCAEEIGVSNLMVGHHYGEIIDYAVPVLKILPAIRQALPKATLAVDTGFMRGTDILKALALGADVVGILEPVLLGYIADGSEGVEEMFAILTDELKRNMLLTGFADVSSVDDSVLHTV